MQMERAKLVFDDVREAERKLEIVKIETDALLETEAAWLADQEKQAEMVQWAAFKMFCSNTEVRCVAVLGGGSFTRKVVRYMQ